MPGQPTPPLIQQAFALNAAAPYIQNPIPVTTADPERASFNLGFPPQTMMEIVAGGTPPYGQDVNGILYMATAHCAAQQAGQPYLYNVTLSTAMGGYATGCVLGMADGTGLWINTSSGNTTDPDGGSPAGWMPVYSRGFATISGLTGLTHTVTPANYRREVLVLSGVLVSNLQLVLPSGTIGQRSWLVVNTTSGAFTTTVKTAAGSGVVVPQGGFGSPTGVYGDGTNIYPTVAPLVLPIDQNPTPSTIVQRSNLGSIFSTYFNTTAVLDNLAINGIFYESAAADGFIRKMSVANFAAKFALSQFAGAVTAAQVPSIAVTQYSATILASAALTGSPTATTAGAGDNSTRVATTAWVQQNRKLAAITMTGAGSQLGNSVNCSGSRTGVGTYVLNVSSAGFSNNPIPTATLTVVGANPDQIYAQATSATSVTVTIRFAGSPIDRDFNCTMMGA